MSKNQNIKSRTPSGTVIEYRVGEIRNYFSPDKEVISEEAQENVTDVDSQLKKQSTVNELNQCNKGLSARSVNKEKGDKWSTTENSQGASWASDNWTASASSEESDPNFATPPVTPARGSLRRSKRIRNSQRHQKDSSLRKIDINMSEGDQNTQYATDPRKVAASISDELQNMMEEKVNEPQVIDIATVHAMFKKLEKSIDDKLSQMESKQRSDNPQAAPNDSAVIDITKKIENLTITNKAIKGAVQNMYDQSCETKDRLAKLESNVNRRMVVLTGLSVNKAKDIARREIDEFLLETLDINQKIEDFYEIGSAQPRAKVLILHSLRDKMKIIRRKSRLNKFVNQHKKPFYINEYYPAETNERRKTERQLYKRNEERPDQYKAEMTIEAGRLKVAGAPYIAKIQPPNPQQLLDISTERLKEILQIPICKGPTLEKEANEFIGFSLCVESFGDVEAAYFKMRICYPKARHIICAYNLPGDDHHYSQGFCDDGEHGAGTKLLDMMVESDIESRVLFVTRKYSGIKIGGERFNCVLQAAEKCMELYPFNNITESSQEVRNDIEIPDPRPRNERDSDMDTETEMVQPGTDNETDKLPSNDQPPPPMPGPNDVAAQRRRAYFPRDKNPSRSMQMKGGGKRWVNRQPPPQHRNSNQNGGNTFKRRRQPSSPDASEFYQHKRQYQDENSYEQYNQYDYAENFPPIRGSFNRGYRRSRYNNYF